MTFRMRPASKTCRRPASGCRLRPYNKSAGLPSPMFPPTSLAAGVPAAHRPTANAQRIEAQVKRCGDVLSAVNGQIQFSRAKLFTLSQVTTDASDFDK
jgi:hypothetical protein